MATPRAKGVLGEAKTNRAGLSDQLREK